jgi:hypothetical protein
MSSEVNGQSSLGLTTDSAHSSFLGRWYDSHDWGLDSRIMVTSCATHILRMHAFYR